MAASRNSARDAYRPFLSTVRRIAKLGDVDDVIDLETRHQQQLDEEVADLDREEHAARTVLSGIFGRRRAA